jgi:hypothetical protein
MRPADNLGGSRKDRFTDLRPRHNFPSMLVESLRTVRPVLRATLLRRLVRPIG